MKKQSLCVFFEGAIISYVTKAHFIKKQSLSVYFLREQLFESLWLLISVADALYFLLKSPQAKLLLYWHVYIQT